MKVAVLGQGKTGSKVVDILTEKKIPFTVFNSSNPPTKEGLKNHLVAICFLAAEPFSTYVELLIESKMMVVSGTTGFVYNDELKKRVKNDHLKWIVGNNFSLGMNLVQQMIKVLGLANLLIDNPVYQIHEIHHTKKLDAPSGTALSFERWLGHQAQITSERKGDVIGFHELTLKSSTEEIKLSHNALDRKIFAEGAIWAYSQLINNPTIPSGINSFQDIVEKEILK